jgi:uncharacterized protein (DUF4415 family)
MKTENINFDDIAETDLEFWQDAKIVKPKNKQQITIRIDSEVLDFFKQENSRYQTKINQVLKSYMLAHKKVS